MTDDKLEYTRTIVTQQRCAFCKRPSHYFLIEHRDGYLCFGCDRLMRMRWSKP